MNDSDGVDHDCRALSTIGQEAQAMLLQSSAGGNFSSEGGAMNSGSGAKPQPVVRKAQIMMLVLSQSSSGLVKSSDGGVAKGAVQIRVRYVSNCSPLFCHARNLDIKTCHRPPCRCH